jgi:hypothetical protein
MKELLISSKTNPIKCHFAFEEGVMMTQILDERLRYSYLTSWPSTRSWWVWQAGETHAERTSNYVYLCLILHGSKLAKIRDETEMWSCGGRSPRHSRRKKCGAWSCTPARVGFGAELRSIRSYELVWESRGRVAATAGVCSSKPDKIWSNSSPSKYLRGSNKGPRMLNLSIFPENSFSCVCLWAVPIGLCHLKVYVCLPAPLYWYSGMVNGRNYGP